MIPNGETAPVPASDASGPDASASDVSTSDLSASGGRRRLDAQSLKGLAHPLRMRILELLSLDGAATSSTLARRLGENTGTVSWHLRHLAEHGFIEEEAGRGTRRERWWRRVPRSNQLDIADFRDDPASSGALSVYLDQLLRQYFERVTAYVGEDWDDEWRAAGTVADWRDLRLTVDELGAMNAELANVVDRYRTHSASRPASADSAASASASASVSDGELRPVVVQLQSFPRKGPGPS